MELTLETKVAVVASASHDGVGVTTYELLRAGEVVETLPGSALENGRIAFPEREEAVGAPLKIRAHIVLDSDEKIVEV